MTTPEEALRARNLASNRRWRLIFGLLAVVVPLALFAAFTRQETRLQALAANGRAATAVVTGVRGDITYYEYEADGTSHDWNVRRADAPYPIGARFAITYLPEDPGLSRPIANYSMADYEREVDRGFKRAFLFGLFTFFALASLACHVSLQRMLRGAPMRTGPVVSPRTLGTILAAVLVACVVGAEFDAKVREVQSRLWGSDPLGVPVGVLVAIVDAVLFAPLFVMMPLVMEMTMRAAAAGRSISAAGIVRAVADAGPEHRRAKRIVVAIALYFVALFAGWIAYAASRGV
jgi:hypothetical protein